MLDIVITHYREPWEVCKKLFQSLDIQRGVDWREIRVTVIHDGTWTFDELLDGWAFQARQVCIPHGGISRARNAGLDLATEPWVMFCDCDDAFANIYALEDVMNVLKAPDIGERFDVLWTHCWEETADGAVFLIPNHRVFVFCHGKAYNRAFLMREGIRFEPELTFNEDSCFNAVIVARTNHKRVGEIRGAAPVYSWIRRPGSVTADPARVDEGTYCNFRRNLIATEENRLHRPDQYAAMVTRTAYDVFYMIHGSRNSESCKQRIMGEFTPWIRERRKEFGDVTPEVLDGIRAIARDELREEGDEVCDEHGNVREWVRLVTEGQV